jgi:hypothetical protein
MSEIPHLYIKIPKDKCIILNQGSSIEEFVLQFQPLCSSLIYIINGEIIKYHDKYNTFPDDLCFVHKIAINNTYVYYFRSISMNATYSIFGRTAALMIYPQIDIVDPIIEPIKIDTTDIVVKSPGSLYTNESQSNTRPTHSAQDLLKIINPTIDDKSEMSDTINITPNVNISDHRITIKEQPDFDKIKFRSSRFKNSRRRKVTSQKDELSSTKYPTTRKLNTRMSRTRVSDLDKIIIIDKGEEIIFSNGDFPIIINTYEDM